MSNSLPKTIWFTRCPVPTASGIAITKGWLRARYKACGVDFASLRTHADQQIRSSHFTHSLENSFRQGGNAPAIHARASGADTKLIGLQWARQYQAIVAREPRALKGAIIGVPLRPGPEIDFWRAANLQGIQNVLEGQGLTLEDVTIKYLTRDESYFAADPGDQGDQLSVERISRLPMTETLALLRYEVDAILAYGPWGNAIRAQFGLVELARLSEDAAFAHQANNEAPLTLTVSASLLETHPDLVDDYVLELLRTAAWARDNQAEALKILAREMATSEYWVEKSYAGTIVAELDFDLTPQLLAGITLRKDFLRDHGFLPGDFAISDWVDAGPLTRARARLAAEPAQAFAAE